MYLTIICFGKRSFLHFRLVLLLLAHALHTFPNDCPHCESVLAYMLLFFILLTLFLCFRETKGNPREARLKPSRWIQSREDCLSVDSFLRWYYSALVVWVVIVGNIAVCALKAKSVELGLFPTRFSLDQSKNHNITFHTVVHQDVIFVKHLDTHTTYLTCYRSYSGQMLSLFAGLRFSFRHSACKTLNIPVDKTNICLALMALINTVTL